MSEEKQSYRQIMKATSIFGGVQVFQIIIGIIRSKFIALLLGPAGMGISGLLQSTTGLVAGLTNFGLATSAVKDIAEANATNDAHKLAHVTSVFRKMMFVTGLLGLIITLLGSAWFSQITFNNSQYTWAFAFLSITLLLNQLSAEKSTLLQGMRQIKYLAKSSLLGSILGLVFTVPLYYLYGNDGIVPALIITAIIAFLLNWYFVQKVKINTISISWSETFKAGSGMLKMGFLISLNGLIVLFIAYIVRVFINKHGNLEDVGLYNAGFAIMNSYVGMIFTAMSTDYFPRLSAVASDTIKTNETINQQIEVALLIITPIIVLFLITIKWIIYILYSDAFLPIQNMLLFAAVGMVFKAISWSIAFIFLAKSKGKAFFYNELIGNIYILVLNLAGYYYFGLTGLGYAFLLGFVLYTLHVYMVSNKLFKYQFTKQQFSMISLSLFFAIATLCTVLFFYSIQLYIIGFFIFVLSTIYSLYTLNQRMGFVGLLKNRFNQ